MGGRGGGDSVLQTHFLVYNQLPHFDEFGSRILLNHGLGDLSSIAGYITFLNRLTKTFFFKENFYPGTD